MAQTIEIDTGGTFTDGVFVRGGAVRTVKVPTTPHDLTVCFIDCIQAGATAFAVPAEDFLYDTDVIRFSSTIGTNTIIQRDGTNVGLIVTAGMEALAPGVDATGKPPLVRPDMVASIDERVAADGTLITTPAEDLILDTAQGLIDRGARCLLVAFENSELDPVNERRVREVIKREYPRDYLGSVPVFVASDISPRTGYRERINTSVLNAYMHGKLTRLLYKAGEDLRQRRYRGTLFIGHNNGAVARVAKTRAIQTYNSGPAAGLMGARATGRLYDSGDLIAVDMGGTSFDVGVVRAGAVDHVLEPDIEGFRCNLPMISVRALGSGGGSIAHVADGRLWVGPQSAGALPGPACFGLGGTRATVTDANLVLGILDPDYFLGGTMPIDPGRARVALETHVAGPLGIPVEQAALSIRQTVDEAMGQATAEARAVFDAAQAPLMIAYGGAAGLHACAIAQRAGLRRVVLTPFSAVFSAFSSSMIDVGHLYYCAAELELAEAADCSAALAAVADMARRAARDMRGEGFSDADIRAELQLFVRRGEGGREIMLRAPTDAFEQDRGGICARARQALSTAAQDGEGTLRLTGVGYMARVAIPHFTPSAAPRTAVPLATALKGSRTMLLDPAAGPDAVPIYDHARLEHGHEIAGPAVVETVQTSILVSSGWRLRVDAYNHVVLEDGSR